MLFSSQFFLVCFLPAVLFCYHLTRKWQKLNQLTLISFSLLFYGIWNYHYVPLLLGLGFINWAIGSYSLKYNQKIWLGMGIGFDLLVLIYFKYTNFLAGIVSHLISIPLGPWPIILPLGISFFIFQKISYLADIYTGSARRYKFLDFMEFVTFFPQLIAGPLVRHNELIPQFTLDQRNQNIWKKTGQGICLFAIGLIKKAGLADELGKMADPLFAAGNLHHTIGTIEAWVGALAYYWQIYFDFSGYSDMAIGLGLLFGLQLPFNFNAPYQALSLQDFWRRWHMTLSRFLRDYVYIPLGGNRCGSARHVVNLIITMLFAGLWHGAGWTFIVWGGLHGIGLAVHHIWKRFCFPLPPFIAWVITFLFIVCSWVVFRAPDFSTADIILSNLFVYHPSPLFTFPHLWLFLLCGVFSWFGPTSQVVVLKYLTPTWPIALLTGATLVFFFFLAGGRIPNAFIYFQF